MKKFLSEIEDNFCAVVLAVMLILTFINVVARYLLKSSMPFVEELTTLGLVIISLTGAAVAAKRGAHLGLTVLSDLMPKSAQKILVIIGYVLGALFGVVLLIYGIEMTQQEYNLQQLTAGMQWPEWMFGIFVPISGVVLIIRYLQMAVMGIVHFNKNDEEEKKA